MSEYYKKMKNRSVLIILKFAKGLVFLFAGILCAVVSYAQTPQDIRSLVKRNNSFAVKLFAKLQEGATNENIFLSPYSISTAFSIMYAGASSDTARQIAETFNFSSDTEKLCATFCSLQNNLNSIQKEKNVELSIANGIWAQRDFRFNVNFLYLVSQDYGSELALSDFRKPEIPRSEINEWVDKKTKSKIKEMIPEGVLSDQTKMVLINAIYFKGSWDKKFIKNSTKIDKFWISTSTCVDVKMMYQKNNFSYQEKEDVQVIELPYSGNDLSMIILLPKEIDGIEKIEKDLTLEKLYRFTQGLWDQEVKVFFPKFKFSSDVDLKKLLEKMGVTYAFSSLADFSLMTDDKDLFISDAIHKAFVEVDEEGTEAGASTAVVVNLTSARIEKKIPEFRADRPFLFFIKDNESGSILFLGKFMNPS
ncbi:MAG: serpin family protein [Elusimicrobia bacterium]|nr:serpin family protein [Elusimicrobiota bacterium]